VADVLEYIHGFIFREPLVGVRRFKLIVDLGQPYAVENKLLDTFFLIAVVLLKRLEIDSNPRSIPFFLVVKPAFSQNS